jgi:hypothetical protein
MKVTDYDIIYLSYDEPNAEKNYADLLTKVPWAKRVHGVKGSDAAHKACAMQSETDRLIIVAGDNVIDPEFLNQEFSIDPSVDLDKSVLSWTARNTINGLVYGNGGIKSWPKDVLLNMRTHENAAPDNIHAQVDFCWDINYYHMEGCFSTILNNETPQQAWRAGFREGVKMALREGRKISPIELKNLHWKNLHRLYVWCMVGADVPNGDWSILGARAGLYKTMCTDWDYIQVRDFEYLNHLWNEEFVDFEGHEVFDEACRYTNLLVQELDIPLDDPLLPGQSRFFKTVYKNPERAPVKQASTSARSISNYDIVFISYNEPNADKNWELLKHRFPRAQRVHGIKGIHQAHIEAAKLCTTPMFYVVDGDAVIKDTFNFDYYVNESDYDVVHVWRSENKVKGLEYGYGGIKLLPRQKTINMDISRPDMTTSISHRFKPVKEVANITEFNTDPFNAWKSAFRECAKLSSKVIDRQKDDETNIRLDVWTSDVGKNEPFGNYVTAGAKSGRLYGETNRGNLDALKLINDFEWLRIRFNNEIV